MWKAKELPVKVYWDDVKLKALSELVKSEERRGYGDVRMEKVR